MKLKQLRYNLGLTQDDMAAGVMERSRYSRIENGKVSAKADEVIKLLKVHDVSLVDVLEDEEQVDLEQWQDQVIDAYFNQDVEELKQLKNREELNNQRDKFAVEMLIAKLEGNDDKFTPALKRKMKHVFLGMKDFNKNILWLLLVYMNLYEFTELGSLMDVIFSRYQKAKNLDRRTHELMASICVSYLKICSREDKDGAEFFQAERTLETVPDFADVFLQKLIGQYLVFKIDGQDKWAEFVKDLVIECGYLNYLKM